ncbi:hypothetical protein Calag_0711 [Caldisphaera lagunensis DSM 15908]|uniref:Uncharacterized protein n=1 Tax=Caldisphaera lagunensis (strain DSM 15908 / JCM 11604 / ANMR 0165 / IC-154) TaxID=1056495 RepID=L0A9A7_CALLD|nr:hypothetical protein [Caldisphaera lagunensis]AFZ70456.1 hypothetical protein Calag_0711 [Caldisphaera lagunensis DSM 15908]
MHKKLYRIYFTEFDEENFRKIINALEEKYSSQINVIKSNVIDEFRALELYFEKEGYSDEIKNLISSLTGTQYVRVDYIDTTK